MKKGKKNLKISGGICLDQHQEIPDDYKNILSIGKNTVIKTGTILAGDGFHFHRDENDILLFNEHTHGLVIGDNVWIGSNCTIDRGRWRDTAVGGGSKIDNGVHISHNCIIGENCIIGTGAIILGSVEIGNCSEIWSSAIIHQGVKVGNNCAVGAGTYLRHDLPDNYAAYTDNNGTKFVPMEQTKKYSKVKKKRGGGV